MMMPFLSAFSNKALKNLFSFVIEAFKEPSKTIMSPLPKLSVITDAKEIKNILDNKDIKVKELKSKGLFTLRQIELQDKSFILIQTPNEKVILADKSFLRDNKSTIFIVYITIVLIFAFLYLSNLHLQLCS